jgi:hypothetical protein
MTNPISIEYVTRTELTENGGKFPLEFSDITESDFLPHQTAFADSEYLGSAGFYTKEQGAAAITASIDDCIRNQPADNVAEFIIPLDREAGNYLLICIGKRPSEG